MKYIIIFLLSTTGIEEIKIKTPDCNKLAESWRQVNTTYHFAVMLKESTINTLHFNHEYK
tara:strand:+ start:79 stop:258 length:180 start_codon:yes stop_codon:yes gene_type:complete